MLWFNFILGLNFIFYCFRIYYHTLPYAKTIENKILTKDKIEPQHIQVEIFAVTCICRHWIINSQCVLCFVLLMQILRLYDVFQVNYCSVLICFDFNALQCYSQTSHKRPPKMQRVSGCLQYSNHRRSFTVHFTMSSPDTIFLERMYYMQFSFYVNPCCL